MTSLGERILLAQVRRARRFNDHTLVGLNPLATMLGISRKTATRLLTEDAPSEYLGPAWEGVVEILTRELQVSREWLFDTEIVGDVGEMEVYVKARAARMVSRRPS